MEIVQLRKQGVVAFRLPNTTYGKGYSLNDWKDMIWEGNLLVITMSQGLIVRLVNNDQTEFGSCPVPRQQEQAVVKTQDSSRGFALRLENKGRYAWVGMAFRDRNDAFDFSVCLQEQGQRMAPTSQPKQDSFQARDFSIQKGQKIKLNITRQEKEEEEEAQPTPIPQQTTHSFAGFEHFGQSDQLKESAKFEDFQGFDNKTAFQNNQFGFSNAAPVQQNMFDFSQEIKDKNDFGDFDFASFGGHKEEKKDEFTFGKPQTVESENLIDL